MDKAALDKAVLDKAALDKAALDRMDLDKTSPPIAGKRPGRPGVLGLSPQALRKLRIHERDRMIRSGSWLAPGTGRVIALDLGTRCGVAQYDQRRHGHADCVDVGCLRLSPRSGEGAGMRPLRLRQFLEWVLDSRPRSLRTGGRLAGGLGLFVGGPVTMVAYEKVFAHMGTQAAHVYGQLQGTVIAACEERNIPYRAVGVGAAKLAGCGHGQASKGFVLDSVSILFRPWCARLRTTPERRIMRAGGPRRASSIGEDEGDALAVLAAALMGMD